MIEEIRPLQDAQATRTSFVDSERIESREAGIKAGYIEPTEFGITNNPALFTSRIYFTMSPFTNPVGWDEDLAVAQKHEYAATSLPSDLPNSISSVSTLTSLQIKPSRHNPMPGKWPL